MQKIAGVHAAGDDSLVVTVGFGHGAKADRAIGQIMDAGREIAFCPMSHHF